MHSLRKSCFSGKKKRKRLKLRFARRRAHANLKQQSPTIPSAKFVAHTLCPSVWPERTQMEAHSVLAAPHNCAEMLGSSTAMKRAEPSTMGSMLLYSYPVLGAETHNCSPTLNNMPADLRITWHVNETRLDKIRCLKTPRRL